MRKKHYLRIAIVALGLTGSLLLISAVSAGKSTCTKESIDECCKKKNTGEADKKSWETLSRQFFSSI
jgi:hypothetical protein